MKNVSKGAACLPSATALVVATPNPAPADSTHIATGPVTSWSYGYIAADAGAFSLLEGGHTYHGMPAWSRTPRYPIIAFNNSLNDDPEGLGVGNFRVPRNRILLVPGRTGEFATVRWTDPANGRYPVQGLFDGLDTCVSSHVRITKDGDAALHLDGDGRAQRQTFSVEVSLHANEEVDFGADYGPNRDFHCDVVGLSAMITML